MKKNKLLYFLVASTFILTSCNSNAHTEEPIDSTSDTHTEESTDITSDTHTEEQPIDARPIVSADGTTMFYGLYPQTNINDSTLISSLNSLTMPESNGWYLYDGDYYAKIIAEPDNSSNTFDNGTVIVEGTTYWFKCEPIAWNILSNTNGEYYVVSSVLLDVHCYYNSTSDRTIDDQTVYANNYKYSDIRTWLNKDFYNLAFPIGNEFIQTTTVDNSASTTDSESNAFACDNTEDKIFLPSYQDYMNSSYGFSATESRCCKTTDWARARGAFYNTGSPNLYNGAYWTRSPYSGVTQGVRNVGTDGNLGGTPINNKRISVRPAITIKIS